MKIRRAHGCEVDIKLLRKTYRSATQDVIYFERLLRTGFSLGHTEIPGLKLLRDGRHARVFKARVVCTVLGSKRDGFRYVYERIADANGDEYAVALAIYAHQKGDDEADIRSQIKQRHASFESEDLDGLFAPDLDADDPPAIRR